VVVDVTAFKWNWEFAYEGQLGTDGKRSTPPAPPTVVPILVVPPASGIRFGRALARRDAIVLVPELLFKRDVFPGNVVNQVRGDHQQRGQVRRSLRGTVWHVPLDDELRAPIGLAGPCTTRSSRRRRRADHAPGVVVAGFVGDDAYATTTQPFELKRESGNTTGTAS